MAFVLPSLSVKSYLYPLWKETFEGKPIYIKYDKSLVFYDGKDDLVIDTPTGVWGRVTVRNAVNTPSLGANPLNVDQGIIFFDLFAPEDLGDFAMKPIISKAFSLMQNKEMTDSDGSTITTFSPSVSEIGYDGEFRQWQLSTEYYSTYYSTPLVAGNAFNDGFSDGYK